MRYFVLKEGVFLIETSPKKAKPGYTTFYQLNGKKKFTLPLEVGNIRDFDANYYLVEATINRKCPKFHQLDALGQRNYLKQEKDNSDYIVLDEYPFCYDGAGIINGNRNSLFLVNKKTYRIVDMLPETMDVEHYDVKGTKILYSGVDFTNFKGKWSWVYEYDTKTKKNKVLYDKKMQINNVFYDNKRIVVFGTFAKTYGEMEAGFFYELKNKKMNLIAKNEYTFYNAVLSDSRYGKTKSFLKHNEDIYFHTAELDNTILVEWNGKGVTTVLEEKGTVDDFIVAKDTLYVLFMKEDQLGEIYEVKEDGLCQLTHYNDALMKNRYVAKPEMFFVQKKTPIEGWVLKPINYNPRKKYPAILDIHGGPKCAYGNVYMHEMQAWASEGYFVMYCNPRGSDGRGNAFADLRKKFGTIDYEDIMDFVDEVLKRYPAINPKKLGVTGGSYGGYMTNWIIGHTNRFAAAATQRSISNWITEVLISDYGIDFPIEQEYKDLYHCEKELWEMSPLKYVNNAKTPTLFIHSTEDYRCTLPEALQLFTPLTIKGIDTKLVIFKGESHGLSRNGKPLHRMRRLNEITDWMNKYLKKGA